MTEPNSREVEKEEWEFGQLPIISEAAQQNTLDWLDDFGKLSEEAKSEFITRVMAWLEEVNSGLSGAIVGTINGLLEARYEVLANKLTKAEWDDLLLFMQFAHLVTLRTLNEGLRERQENY